MVEGLLKIDAPKAESVFQPLRVKLKRLTRKEEVLKVFQSGRKFVSTTFVIFSLEGDFPDPFYAIHTRKKLGSAVERNRIKRIYREALQRHKASLCGHKVIVIPRTGSRPVTLNQVINQIGQFFSENLRRK